MSKEVLVQKAIEILETLTEDPPRRGFWPAADSFLSKQYVQTILGSFVIVIILNQLQASRDERKSFLAANIAELEQLQRARWEIAGILAKEEHLATQYSLRSLWLKAIAEKEKVLHAEAKGETKPVTIFTPENVPMLFDDGGGIEETQVRLEEIEKNRMGLPYYGESIGYYIKSMFSSKDIDSRLSLHSHTVERLLDASTVATEVKKNEGISGTLNYSDAVKKGVYARRLETQRAINELVQSLGAEIELKRDEYAKIEQASWLQRQRDWLRGR